MINKHTKLWGVTSVEVNGRKLWLIDANSLPGFAFHWYWKIKSKIRKWNGLN